MRILTIEHWKVEYAFSDEEDSTSQSSTASSLITIDEWPNPTGSDDSSSLEDGEISTSGSATTVTALSRRTSIDSEVAKENEIDTSEGQRPILKSSAA